MPDHDHSGSPEIVMPTPEGADWPATSSEEDATGTEGRTVSVDPTMLASPEAAEEVEMCCDGSGRTAQEHRDQSPDHKCCVDG